MKSHATIDETPNPVILTKDSYELLDDNEYSPTEQILHVHTTKGKYYRYYLNCPWPEWWDEFNSKLTKKARLYYSTAWAFAKSKGKYRWQIECIYECIGPYPQNPTHLRVPWLGDWHRRRANGFWSMQDSNKLQSLKQCIRERKTALEAAQALGPLCLKTISRIARISEQIDDAFGGKIFVSDESPDSKINKQRFENYIHMQQQVNQMLNNAMDRWLKAHGLNPTNTDQWMQMAGMAAIGGAVGAQLANASNQLVDKPSNGLPTPTGTDLLLAKLLLEKTQMYESEDLNPMGTGPVIEAQEKPKSNGKARTQ